MSHRIVHGDLWKFHLCNLSDRAQDLVDKVKIIALVTSTGKFLHLRNHFLASFFFFFIIALLPFIGSAQEKWKRSMEVLVTIRSYTEMWS